jgi:YegS/Rv2252/BmrU family lipid kinase
MVVAVGGDGTINEVARGLFEAGGTAAIAVAPFGSGNDFAKVLGMPTEPEAAARAILASPVRSMDLGKVFTDGDAGVREALFVNAVGIGFDGLVADRARSSRKVRGLVGYLYVALKTLVEWRYPSIKVQVGDNVVSEGPSLLATAGNGTCSGAGFYLTPKADPSDGLLDLCVVRRPGAAGILRLVPALLRGSHLAHPAVTYRQVEHATVRSERGLSVHVDGEYAANNAREVRIEVIPAALRIRSPRLG